MVGFNLSAEDRAKLVAEYEAQAKAGAEQQPVKHSGAQAEGGDAGHKKAAVKPKGE